MCKIVQIVRKAILKHSQVDKSEHQRLMNESYKKWRDNRDYQEFLTDLKQLERDAVVLGNFNYQVANGGLSQWFGNRYHRGLIVLQEAAKRVDEMLHTENTKKFLEVLEEVEGFAGELRDMGEADFYDEYEWELSKFDSNYYSFNNELLKDIESYFRRGGGKPWKDINVKLSQRNKNGRLL